MQIAFIIGGVIVVLVFLFALGAVFIRTMRDELNVLWYNLLDKLQYRQDLLPGLVESIRTHVVPEKFAEFQNDIKNIIGVRHKSALYAKCDGDKVAMEHELSRLIKDLFQKAENDHSLKTSTNFLELKKEIKDMEKEIEESTKEYNSKIRSHNKAVKNPIYLLPSKLLKYSRKTIFEFE